MDSRTRSLDHWKKIAGHRRTKAIGIAALVAVILVILQVNNLQHQQPHCVLFADCNLRSIDLHRMQIALSKSGLTEYKIEGKKILVPKLKHALYLQTIAEQNAIPPELRDAQPSSALSNPFLSRSQQISIERDARKQHVQEMVIRLPFVETAWFEMDNIDARAPRGGPRESAVISIRPLDKQPLCDQHIDTVRRMIAGAIAGIDPQQIVVIDLSSGFAWRDAEPTAAAALQRDANRTAQARQKILENRLREALAHYRGLEFSIIVEPGEAHTGQLLATEKTTASEPPLVENDAVAQALQAGANGQISIRQTQMNRDFGAEIELASHTREYDSASHPSTTGDRIGVLIDVPYELVVSRLGDSTKPPSFGTQPTEDDRNRTHNRTDQGFNELKSEIEQIIRPLINDDETGDVVDVTFNLVPPVATPANPLLEKIRTAVQEHWPSLAVLVIGLMLVSIVTRQSHTMLTTSPTADSIADSDSTARMTGTSKSNIANFDAPATKEAKTRTAEVRLSQLIEQDPDAAARVIESWIRDAA